MSTITRGGTTVTPRLVLGWDTTRRSRNIVHEIIGKPSPDVSVQPSAPRTGTLELFFLTEDEAVAADALHAAPGPLVLVNDDHDARSMRYVVDGDVRLQLDPATRLRWTLSVPFREVLA